MQETPELMASTEHSEHSSYVAKVVQLYFGQGKKNFATRNSIVHVLLHCHVKITMLAVNVHPALVTLT
jgi:hypothetical protein